MSADLSVAPMQAKTFFPYWRMTCARTARARVLYTATTGSAPNRECYVEWRAEYFGAGGANFEGRVPKTNGNVR